MEGAGAEAAAPQGGAAQAGSPTASACEDGHTRVTGAIFSSSPILDLSRSGLQHLGDILQIPTLKQLHLQRNALSTLPTDFFQLLPSLTWLDLRHNRIAALPPGVGSHRYLKTLLLERNPIKTLPVELGNVRTLRALNLRHCPVEFPPQRVVQKGSAAVLSFLRACAAAPASCAIPPPEVMNAHRLPHPRGDLPGERAPDRDTTKPRGLEAARPTETGGPGPPVGSLDRRARRRSPGPGEDWLPEEETRRFWKLRQEIVEKEQAEVLENQLLALELPPKLRAMLCAREEARPSPRHTLRRKAAPVKGVLPDPAPAHSVARGAGRLAERRAAALGELREKQALMEQRRRDQRTLQEWREQARAMGGKTEGLSALPPPRRPLVASKAPFAADLPDKARAPVNPHGGRGQSRERSLRASDKLRAGREGAPEEQLKQHIRRGRVFRALRRSRGFGGCRGPGSPTARRGTCCEVACVRTGGPSPVLTPVAGGHWLCTVVSERWLMPLDQTALVPSQKHAAVCKEPGLGEASPGELQ
ncbi:leucine-rich repeat-containing protein 27 [Pteronotus mesoamericanus]|uniref:leucine-rich repeat-containing protein 27 n=1 Tax=Pteronotus mesoamericanus TaxID=1884717 RepID=UPI0023EAA042|nr:leucine-rich repeat-containing protein 27 [Pteronotus parnellii mesoamericanus]